MRPSLTLFSLTLVTLLCVNSPDVVYANNNGGFTGNDVEGQTITRTSGDAGTTCPLNRYKCARNVSCVDDECQCPPGTHGHANLACVDDDTYVTMVLADPKLIRYDGTSTHVSCPCRYLLTEIESVHTMGKSGGTCFTSVHALNHQVRGGYYLLAFDIQVSITDNSKPNTVAHSSIRVFGYGSNGVYEYKEQGKQGTTRNNRPWRAAARLKYMDTIMETRYDFDYNLVIVDLSACGVKAIFRAYVRYTHQMPGLIVTVDKEKAVGFPLTNNPLSGSPHEEDDSSPLLTEKHILRLNKEETTLYNVLTQGTQQDFGIPAITCNVAMTEFTHMCRSPRERAFAVRICAPFFTNSTVYGCLKMAEFGQSSGTFYGMCSLSMCLNDPYLCQELKRELTLFGCATPAKLDDLDCHQIVVTRNTVYPNDEMTLVPPP